VTARQHGHSSRARWDTDLLRRRAPPDLAPVYPRVLADLAPAARHVLDQYANNVVEADHGRLNARLRPMRGLKTIRALRTVAAGHAFVQNLRRGHYELTTNVPAHDRLRVAFTELARCL
jgi:IS6 family transposase